ncbi:PEP-CTERM sorting domain-containing protein [Lacipirellula sp.]|uniref:PEP-CTERM sorting domain-containing protein n=1 Tax=Lacipirellula sp. TaxID=2691419 RepID=UPI003D12535A
MLHINRCVTPWRRSSLGAACLALLTMAAPSSAALILYDGFDYTVGERIVTQTNVAASQPWLDPTSPTPPAAASDTSVIVAGNLGFPGLQAATGNSLALPRLPNGNYARINLPGAPYNATKNDGSLFASFTLKMTNWVTLVSGAENDANRMGAFIAGFHLGTGTGGMSTATAFAGQIRIRRELDGSNVQTGNYQLGIVKHNAGLTPATTAWDLSQSYAVGDELLLVMEYQHLTGTTTDDQVRLWINPTPGAPAGTPSVTAQIGPADVANINSFWFRGDQLSPGDLQIDELRVGPTFADVTPALVPEPATFALAVLGAVAALGASRRR